MVLPALTLRGIARRHLGALIFLGDIFPRGIPLINAVRSRFSLGTVGEAANLIREGQRLTAARRTAASVPPSTPIGLADAPIDRAFFRMNLIEERFAYRVRVVVSGRFRGDEPQAFEMNIGSNVPLSQNEINEISRQQAIMEARVSPAAAEAVFNPASMTVRYEVLFAVRQY